MAQSLRKTKARREAGTFVSLPTAVLSHPNFFKLSGTAIKLLTGLMEQLRFKKGGTVNNGDLTATWSIMKVRGWKSKETLQTALEELLHYEFIVLTRQGERLRKDRPSLYAISFFSIDECGGKLDVPPTSAPLSCWKLEKPDFKRKSKRSSTLKNSYPENRGGTTPKIGVKDEESPALGVF